MMVSVRRPAQMGLRSGVLAAAAALGVAAIYILFVGTHAGRAVDRFLLDHRENESVETPAQALVAVVNVVTIPLAVAVIVAMALRSGRRATALWAVVLIVGSSLTTAGLEALLGPLDPLGGERRRDLGAGFYPSGHAALIMSLCLAAILVAPPARRQHLAVGAGCAAALLGGAVFVGGSHHLSDVLGGFLVALGWAAACFRGAQRTEPPRDWKTPNRVVWRSSDGERLSL
jgi:membrane-associated phospholipid phosphatase